MSRFSPSLADKLSKIKLGNLVKNANLNNLDNWLTVLATNVQVVNNVASFTATAQYGQIKQNLGNSIAGHKYFIAALVQTSSSLVWFDLDKVSSGAIIARQFHTGSGNFELLSMIAEPTTSEAMNIRVCDSRTSGFNTVSVKQIMCIDLTTPFGIANEPTAKEDVQNLIEDNNSDQLFFESALTTNIAIIDNFSKDNVLFPLYISKTEDVIDTISKYNDTKDLRVRFKKTGNNLIFNFAGVYLIDNKSPRVIPDTTIGTALVTMGTDWLSPYIVLATANIDGDDPSSQGFTGGNHGYNSDGTGSATGRTTDIQLYVDGRKYETFSGYANYIDIYWSNRVQASNIKKIDGTGREVLQENFHLHYDGYKFEIDCNIEFLEAVNLIRYYGFSCSNTAWNGYVFYHNSANKQWNVGTIDSVSGDKNCNLVTLKKAPNYLDIVIDSNLGLGNKEYLSSGNGCFTKDYSKTYFYLVDSSTGLSANDVVSYRGYYRFYNK